MSTPAETSSTDPVGASIRRPRRGLVAGAGLWAGLLLAGLTVWRTSNAAFSASTSNAGNSWAAGTVTIGDDDSGSALFNATGLTPGATNARCIVVSYSGSVSAEVRLYGAAISGGLADYLDLVVEEGSGGSFGDCAGFTPSASLFTGTLGAFASSTDFATGLGSWAPAGPGQSRTYRFSYAVRSDNAAQGTTGAASFVWEARST